MVALLAFPGREFPGFSVKYEIDSGEFKSVRTRAERGESLSLVGKVWDAICDWFCKTSIGEAKACLHALYAPNTSDAEKLQNFHRLRELASDPYKPNFCETALPDGFAIGLSVAPSAFLYSHHFSDPSQVCNSAFIEREINTEIKAAVGDDTLMMRSLDAFARDIGRATYCIDGERYAPAVIAGREASYLASDFLIALAERLKCTVAQLNAVNVLAYQKIFGILMQSSLEGHGGLLRPEDTLRMSGTAEKLEYGFRKRGDDIEISALFQGNFGTIHESLATPASPSRAGIMTEPTQHLVLRVNPDGVASVVSAAYGMAPVK